MMILVSGFAAIAVWVHTSVGLMPVALLFPMVLCPFYRDWKMMVLQAGISTALYAAYQGYFLPYSPYLPPENLLIDVTIFAGCTFVTFVLEEQVNLSYILQEEKSVRDSLTHLYNHETFYEELEYHMKRYEEKKETFSVMIADIDNFKKSMTPMVIHLEMRSFAKWLWHLRRDMETVISVHVTVVRSLR